MINAAKVEIYNRQLEELTARIAELERRNAMLTSVLKEVSNADIRWLHDYLVEQHVEQALSATSADTEAWLQAEIVKRLGEPAAHMYPSDLERFQEQETFAQAFSVAVGNPDEKSEPLYRLPEPLATPEERKE